MDSPVVDKNGALQALLGYLNFSEGRPDARFQKQLNELYAQFGDQGRPQPWDDVRTALTEALAQLRQAGSAAFRDVAQAEAVIHLTFDEVLPAYRRHHADLLAHQTEADLWQPFFLARVFEAVLRQRGPWEEIDRIVANAIKYLNDYVGHRPIATLESRPEGEPYDHERVRPIPLFLRSAGVASGRYHELIATAIELLEATDVELLRQAHFDPKLLDELALDPRAYDFDHPADKRPNYCFGEWDPHQLDGQARYRRFALRQLALDGLMKRVDDPGALVRAEAVVEAAAVLAGTILMAAGVSGSGPQAHDSTVTLSNLTPRIAKYRDAFYNQLVRRLGGAHAARLQEELKLTKQPFGGARQALNQFLGQQRALQMQRRGFALFFAELGDAAASRRQLAQLPTASARMLTGIHILVTSGKQHIERGRIEQATDCLAQAEDMLQRGIACGAFADPWNILGFQGQYPRFQALEDSVRDRRCDELIAVVGDIFDLYGRLMNEGVDLAAKMRRLAEWWDQFATPTVGDVERLHGGETADSAEHVARALAAWRARGAAAGDIATWREQIADFRTPKAFALVVEALLDRNDDRAAMALLMTWLSQEETTPLEDDDHSFHRLTLRWMLMAAGPDRDPAVALKFFDYLEANAEDLWHVPTLDILGTGEDFPPMPDEDDDEMDDDDDDESLYGAAYDDMSYRDSTDDGIEGEVLDAMPQKDFDLEYEAERLLERVPFLATLARLWIFASPLARKANAHGAAAAWFARAQDNLQNLLRLLDTIHAHAIPEPTTGFEAVIEFERRMDVKNQLLGAVMEACREHILAIGALRGVGAEGAGAVNGPPWEPALLALEQHLRHGERAAARLALTEFREHFRGEPLLVHPLEEGGEPRGILRAQIAHVILCSLAAALPRQGLLRDTWQMLRLARAIEANQPGRGRQVTAFHVPFQLGLQAVVEVVVDAAQRERLGDEPFGAGLEKVVEPFLPMWTDRYDGPDYRTGALEALRNEDDWRKLGEFIRRYGRDLFTRRFLAPDNLHGILHRGIGAYLDDLREQPDPLHPIRLIDELGDKITRDQAERWLRIVFEALLENDEIVRDWNQTCTQADFGDNLHQLLDFLGLKTDYERAAWRFRPLHMVHDVLVRRDPQSAAEWRLQVQQLTQETSQELLDELAELERQHGVRLATMRQRLEDRFVGSLEIDRLAALVEPAQRQLQTDSEHTEPSDLEQAIEPLAAVPHGVGLTPPPWLVRLQHELQRVRQAQDPLVKLAETRLQVPKAELPFADLVREFDGWEQTAQE